MKTAFVIMPFSSTATCTERDWTEIYAHIFRPAFEAAGYECERAAPMTGRLLDSILNKLHQSQVVMADITDRNANVFYELGIRHCLRTGTIIVTQAASHLPSDLQGMWHTQYGTRPAEVNHFKEEIKRLVNSIETNAGRSDNSVSDYLERERLSVSRFVQKDNLKKLGALATELGGNKMVLTDREVYRELLSYGCLDLLINTMYVDPGPDVLSKAYELRVFLKRIDMGDSSKDLLNSAVLWCTHLLGEIYRLRESYAQGQYTEPDRISVMTWMESRDDQHESGPSD